VLKTVFGPSLLKLYELGGTVSCYYILTWADYTSLSYSMSAGVMITGKRKLKYSENLSQPHSVYHKSHMEYPETKPLYPR
jgi:hypothetical protein